jgi:hypothetical protein
MLGHEVIHELKQRASNSQIKILISPGVIVGVEDVIFPSDGSVILKPFGINLSDSLQEELFIKPKNEQK